MVVSHLVVDLVIPLRVSIVLVHDSSLEDAALSIAAGEVSRTLDGWRPMQRLLVVEPSTNDWSTAMAYPWSMGVHVTLGACLTCPTLYVVLMYNLTLPRLAGSAPFWV